MISVNGGVVSIGRNDKIQALEVMNAIVVLDLDKAKDDDEVRQWIIDRCDGQMRFSNCEIMNNAAYARHLMTEAMATSMAQRLLTYHKSRVERILMTPLFWLTIGLLHVICSVVPMLKPASYATMAVIAVSMVVQIYYAVRSSRRNKRARNLLTSKEKQNENHT
jgi:hypothetical protein